VVNWGGGGNTDHIQLIHKKTNSQMEQEIKWGGFPFPHRKNIREGKKKTDLMKKGKKSLEERKNHTKQPTKQRPGAVSENGLGGR